MASSFRSPGRLFRAATRRWLGPFAASRKIVKVTVRDQEFRIVRELTSEPELAAFRNLWAALVEADQRPAAPPPGRALYKLQIQSIQSGRRANATWFYSSGGTVELLAIWRAIWIAPLYRTPSPAAFEALLRGDRS